MDNELTSLGNAHVDEERDGDSASHNHLLSLWLVDLFRNAERAWVYGWH